MSPGGAVGAGGAFTSGEKGFGPLGSRRGAFSVGSADGVVVVVVVVVEVSGAFSSSFAHAAERPTRAVTAAIPAMAERRRVERRVVMDFPFLSPDWRLNRSYAIRHWELYPNCECTPR